MRKLLYLCNYDTEDNIQENRKYYLSAVNKINYTFSALNQAGWYVEIVSVSETGSRHGFPGKNVRISEHTTLTLLPTIGRGCKAKRLLRFFAARGRRFFYLLRNLRRGEVLLVYHSPGYIRMLLLLKWLKGFRLVLEVNEIYADVSGNEDLRKWEMRLFRAADAYLFATELLNESINKCGKPYAVCLGTYRAENERNCNFEEEAMHGKIHLVYAGILNLTKGAFAATQAAEFLDERYHMHILGFGSDQEKELLMKSIQKTKEKTQCGLTYDGTLSGEEYIRFLQSCDIGLSTQNPGAAYNATSFPSKVLSYLANGLRVVSIRINAVEKSAVGDLITYYDEQIPIQIANAIKSVDFSREFNVRKRIRELDTNFKKDIDKVLKSVQS